VVLGLKQLDDDELPARGFIAWRRGTTMAAHSETPMPDDQELTTGCPRRRASNTTAGAQTDMYPLVAAAGMAENLR